MLRARFALFASVICALGIGGCSSADSAVEGDSANVVEESGPPTLSFDELVTLSKLAGRRVRARYQLDGAPAGLEDKVNTILDTPRISNKAFSKGSRRF